MIPKCMSPTAIGDGNRPSDEIMRRQKSAPVRRLHRVALLAAFIAVAPVLAGCADFDPDKLDVFGLNDKKKLPGDRQPLFPEGVPGVSQGIPAEYRMGSRPADDPALAATAIAPAAQPETKEAAAPAQEPKPQAKPKPKPKQTVKRTPKPAAPVANTAAPAAQQAPAAAWPTPAQQPAAQEPAAWPGTGQSSTTSAPTTAPWPSAPPPGTFTR